MPPTGGKERTKIALREPTSWRLARPEKSRKKKSPKIGSGAQWILWVQQSFSPERTPIRIAFLATVIRHPNLDRRWLRSRRIPVFNLTTFGRQTRNCD